MSMESHKSYDAQIVDITSKQNIILTNKLKRFGTWFGWGYSRDPQNGTLAGSTYKSKYIVRGLFKDLQVVYANFTNPWGDVNDKVNAVPITIKASITINGVVIPLFFNGARTVVLQPGCTIMSDPCGISVPANTLFYTNTYMSVPVDTNKAPAGYLTMASIAGDATDTGIVSGGQTQGYGPLTIIGYSDQKAIIGFGDSIMVGKNDSTFVDSELSINQTIYNGGWFTRALKPVLPFLNLSKESQKISDVIKTECIWGRGQFFKYGTSIVSNLGINDLPTDNLATIQANLIKLWALLASYGLKVYHCTITPRTTSTDSWATVENQTPYAWESVRVAVNNWLRDTSANGAIAQSSGTLTGIFEMADIIEGTRNSGKWALIGSAASTSDGLHPLANSYTAMAVGFDYTKLI